jgi:hypothetical protein
MFVKDFGTNTEKYRAMLKDIENSTGVTKEAYKKMAETSAQQFERMKQSFKAIRIAAGATILPVINQMLRAITAVLTPIADFAQRHKLLSGIMLGGAIAISGVVAALGVMGIAIGMAIKGYTNMRIAASLFTAHKWRMIPAIKSMTGALMLNIKAMAIWTAGIARMSFGALLSGIGVAIKGIKAFSFAAIAGIRAVGIAIMANPIGLAITALTAGATLIIMNWGRVKAFLGTFWEGIKTAWGTAVGWVGSAIDWLGQNWKKVLNAFLWVNPITMPILALNKLIRFVFGINLFDAGKKILQSLYQGMKSFIDKPVEAIKGLAQKMRNLLPFSPAKEGPFKDLHKIRIIETIAETMKPAPMLTAMGSVMSATRQAISPTVMKGSAVKQSSVMSGSVTVNYNPTVNINGASLQAKEDFAAMLKKHQHELLKLIQDAQAKNMRLAY